MIFTSYICNALLNNYGPHFLCWISGVVPFNTWLISSWEENNCCYKLSNWQNDNFDHFEWNRCHFVHLLSLLTTQLEIAHMLNGTTPETQKMRTTVRSNQREDWWKSFPLWTIIAHTTPVQKYGQGQNRSSILCYFVLTM